MPLGASIMKTIVIGDIHGRNIWKAIYEKEKPDRIVFIGDYFDSFDISSVKQQNNFLDICAFKNSGICEVILLIGNHDHHYFRSVGEQATKGYQPTYAMSISFIIDDNKHLMQLAYMQDDILFTHAGVSQTYMNDVYGKNGWKIEEIANDLNELWQYKPLAFIFYGTDMYGDNKCQSPIWIRPRSMMADSKDISKKLVQVVGHTKQDQLIIDKRYCFIDTLGTSEEYLIIEDGKFKTGKL